jgi:hypothetical protein
VLADGVVVGRIFLSAAALERRRGCGRSAMATKKTAHRLMATRRRGRMRWPRSQGHGGETFRESTFPDMSPTEQFWMRSQRVSDARGCDGRVRKELATAIGPPCARLRWAKLHVDDGGW